MRNRLTTVAVAVLLLLALVPGVVFAASKAFSASGVLAQDEPGAPGEMLSGDAAAVAATTTDLAADFFAPFGAATFGIANFDQGFVGQLDDSNWGAIKNSAIDVTQNSWFTFPGLAESDFQTIAGVAWGTFTVTKLGGNTVTGLYAAVLSGTLLPDLSCDEPHPIVPGFGALVNVVDDGIWVVDATSEVRGALAKVEGSLDFNPADPGLRVTATGCLGSEVVTMTVQGTH